MLVSDAPAAVVAISPHLDDAVMSAGATLHALTRAGNEVIVATVFAGDPLAKISDVARRFHIDCGLPDGRAMALRRQEDRRALATLGCRHVHLKLRDAIYRQDQYGDWQCSHDRAMFDDDLAAEPAVESSIIESAREVIDSVADRRRVTALLCCAAIGGHVDHRLVTRAAAKVGTDLRIPVLRWEDLPYACSTETLAAAMSPNPILSVPDPVDWQAKEVAMRCYTSQLGMLWPAGENGWSALLEHGIARGNGVPAEVWAKNG